MNNVIVVKVISKRVDKWHKEGQKHIVFDDPKIYCGGLGYQVVGHSGGILLEDCEVINDDPTTLYYREDEPEGLTTIKELLEKQLKGKPKPKDPEPVIPTRWITRQWIQNVFDKVLDSENTNSIDLFQMELNHLAKMYEHEKK